MIRYWLRISTKAAPIELLSNAVSSIGRAENCDVVLTSPYISRVQCLIDTTSNPAILLDGNGSIRSKNGTVVNGIIYGGEKNKNAPYSVFLYNNDSIKLGDVFINFLMHEYDSELLDDKETR